MRVVLIGAGGHARVVLDAARSQGLDVAAAIDMDVSKQGHQIDGVPIVGDERELPALRSTGISAAILGVGSIDVGPRRAELFARIAQAGFQLPVVRHASSVVAPTASIGDGTVVFANVVVNPGTRIGRNVILNTAALVDHDCLVGDHVHISPGARLAGGVRIGEGSHIGIGATVIQGLRIGERVLIAAGAVVVRDVDDGSRIAGVPGRPMVQP